MKKELARKWQEVILEQFTLLCLAFVPDDLRQATKYTTQDIWPTDRGSNRDLSYGK